MHGYLGVQSWDKYRMKSQFSFTSRASHSKTLRSDPLHFLPLQSEGSQQLWPTPGTNIDHADFYREQPVQYMYVYMHLIPEVLTSDVAISSSMPGKADLSCFTCGKNDHIQKEIQLQKFTCCSNKATLLSWHCLLHDSSA